MTLPVSENQGVEKKIFSEGRGKYSLLDGNKVYQFEFPITSSLEDNFASISFIKDKLFEAIQNKDKEEKAKAIQPQEILT
jgi:hypothetical protein